MDKNKINQNHAENALEDEHSKFQAWVNNHMTLILLYIEHHRARPAERFQEVQFFLRNIEHHFVATHSEPSVWQAFEFLKMYFKTYSESNAQADAKAIHAIGIIYAALGLNFKFNHRGVSHEEKHHLVA